MKSIKNPCSIIIIVRKKKLPQELSLTLFILRHFLTQEKKNYCRTAEKDVRFFPLASKAVFQDNKDIAKVLAERDYLIPLH